jgi:predicted permease
MWNYLFSTTWKSLIRKPNFLIGIVASISLTLAALFCVFTLLHLMIIKPLPYKNPEKLFAITQDRYTKDNEKKPSYYTYPNIIHLYQNEQPEFDQKAISYTDFKPIFSHPEQPVVHSKYISSDWFELFGTSFHIGRGFSKTEEVNTFNPVAVISYDSWVRYFDRDANILSRKITINNVSFNIIGVTDESFTAPQIDIIRPPEIFLPWDYNTARGSQNNHFAFDISFELYVRLKDKFSISQAEEKMRFDMNEWWRNEIAGTRFAGQRIDFKMTELKTMIQGNYTDNLWLLFWGALGLVLIAICNVSNLLIARVAENQKQFAIQAALGAKKSDMFKTLLAESSLIMTLSALVAMTFSNMSFVVLRSLLHEDFPRLSELSIDLLGIGFMIGVSAVIALAFATIGLSTINYQTLKDALSSSGKGTGIQVARWVRTSLLATQVTVVLTIVYISLTVALDSFSKITKPKGLDESHLAHLVLSSPSTLSDTVTSEETRSMMLEVKEKLESLPEVSRVSQSGYVFNNGAGNSLKVVGEEERQFSQILTVEDQYFDIVHQPFIAGSTFSPDQAINPTSVIINEVLAKNLGIADQPIDQRLTFNDTESYVVVGVVKGVRSLREDEIPPRLYFPSSQSGNEFIIEKVEGQTINRRTIVEKINEVSKRHSIAYFEEDSTNLSFFILRYRYASLVSSLLISLFSIFLAAIGLFGVTSYSIRMRRVEIGTRMSLGAKSRDLLSLILTDSLKPFAYGAVSSILMVSGSIILLKGETAGYDTIAVAAFLSFASALFVLFLACYFPLRKYLSLSPHTNLNS